MTDPSPPWRVLDTDDGPRTASAVAAPDPGRPALEAGLLRTLALLGVAGLLTLGAFVLAVGSGDGSEIAVEASGVIGDPIAAGPPAPATGRTELVVEVAGAVRKPGLFRVPPGTRVGDLIQAAGGYGPRVDTRRVDAELNLAALVTDGQRVRVPSRDDPAGIPAAQTPGLADGGGGSVGGSIDLNTATLEQLDTLPGIGPVTAEKIVAAREEAPFAAVEELRSRGILGEKTFEEVQPLVTVGS